MNAQKQQQRCFEIPALVLSATRALVSVFPSGAKRVFAILRAEGYGSRLRFASLPVTETRPHTGLCFHRRSARHDYLESAFLRDEGAGGHRLSLRRQY